MKAPDGAPKPERPARRVVLLGASNIRRCLPKVVATACHIWGSPLDILIAAGHGRSYGLSTRVLGRRLPGITQCGLWDDFNDRESLPTAALVTDIGNDIAYGASPAQITRWVEHCFARLRSRCDRVSVTQLPLCSLREVGEAKFWLLRTCLFPRSRLTFNEVIDRAVEVNENLSDIARRFEVSVIAPEQDWYGFDPIHIKMTRQSAAWKNIFSKWRPPSGDAQPERSFAEWIVLMSARPQHRALFGFEQHQAQPCRQLADGSLVSLY